MDDETTIGFCCLVQENLDVWATAECPTNWHVSVGVSSNLTYKYCTVCSSTECQFLDSLGLTLCMTLRNKLLY